MAFHQSWGAEGLDPSVRERGTSATQRTGAPGDWMNAPAQRQLSPHETRDIAEIHQRLDSIARQVEQLSQHPAARGENGVARQLNDAISRLDARLSHMSAPSQQVPTTAAPRMAPPAPTRPAGLDLSIAEIIARQGELDGPSPAQEALNRSAPNFVQAPPMAPAPEHPGFLNIERQIAGLTSQIETLRRPDGIEQSIAAFRSELAEIRHAITEALPRRAIESLEGEIRSLGRRIDETHQTGGDGAALGAIERALSEIRSELRSLTPAEQLAGFDDAIRNLGGKIDTIVRSSGDPATLRQLDEAISALKTIVANIASNEALAQLSENVRTLSLRVDQLSQSGHSDMFAALEQRIAALTTTLEQRERPAADTGHFDKAVRTISDRLDNLQVGGDAASTFGHVEQRVAHLLERLEASETRPGNLNRVESGLSEIMQMLQQRGGDAAPASAAPAMDSAFVDAIRRELSDMRQSQVDTTRHTQDSLEVVHNTLGHVVDRLAQIEGDLRQGRSTPAPAPVPPPAPSRPAAPPIPPQTRPELPNPALLQSAARPVTQMPAKAEPIPSQLPKEPASVVNAAPSRPARSPIDPDLPPDHPLEPGSRNNARPSAAERIASSENALRDIPPPKGPVSSSNFIQAARRAAQAAQAGEAKPASKKANRVTALNDAARAVANAKETSPDTSRSSRVRALLVGASVFVIVLGTFKMASNLWHSGETGRSAPAMESHAVSPAPAASPAQTPDTDDNTTPAPEQSAPPAPSMTSPTPIDKQSMNAPATTLPSWASSPSITPAAPPAQPANADITGSIPSVSGVVAPLPEAIGGPVLRAAALKGDASAAYEIALRYADGRGVTANFEEAAKWYDRAAKANLVPALFRLGTLYEKGLGVRKDIDTANRYYRAAADRGNAKAMHNLAVLEADGGGKPNYKAAAYWFLKAAEHGVADSQFNLGILYARGIGVEQNLAESYKWFSLAAAQGDTDSAHKRDDVAKRLDPASLAKAKLAAQTFKVEQQPSDAIRVATPPGGWDAKRVQKTSSRSAKPKAAKHSTI
ncbi:tetratricopeptide repeat protein [Afipia sp. 1NLS2]|uniref:tetratricopeptide repeat protein n=1 Tax=Afipia sp. 1NLS2 TaxID=666684 RepID=UPI0001D9F55C|nr:tetratricopeptide repeat protein [Afipia sp. 1NLS2]EFI50995.1 Sel1 domain protein repeat-containing protein [Afipia sp. 1NLS2]